MVIKCSMFLGGREEGGGGGLPARYNPPYGSHFSPANPASTPVVINIQRVNI